MTTEDSKTEDPKKEKAPSAKRTRSAGTKSSTQKTPTRRRKSASSTEAKPATAQKSRRREGATRPAAEEKAQAPVVARPLPRLLERLRSEVGTELTNEFRYTSPMQVPRLEKIVLNIGLGEALDNPRAMENATRDLTMVSGQRPVTTRAKKSIAGFKIRQGMAIGLSVTLRGRRMYEFLDRLVSSSLPRVRDFQGVPRDAFDGRGNYSLGIREQVIFPEIDYNAIDRIRGMQIAIVTTARSDREGLRLLELLGMPFAQTRESAPAA